MSKKIKPINFIIDLHVYPYDVMVSIGQSDVELGRTLDSYGISKLISREEIESVRYGSENSHGRAILFSTNQSLLRIRHLPETCFDYGVLAHEVFHIVTMLMHRIGMKLVVEKSCEAYAYLVQYITEQIFERINKHY